jgi:glucokinase
MKKAIGIDLGKTELRAALVDETGRVQAHKKIKTDRANGPEGVTAQLGWLAKEVRASQDVAGVGVCAPGPLNSETGTVLDPPTLPGWKNVELRALLEAQLGMPVMVNNDANAAAYGEWRFGRGRGCRHMVFVMVSTSIGGGVVNDGRLLLGRGGFAAEIGHMCIATDGPTCNCGHCGCWESLASGTALAKFAEEAVREVQSSLMIQLANGGPICAHHVGVAAEQDDPLALALVHEEARYLGIGLVNLLHLYAPEIVVMGGGVSTCLPLMRQVIDEIVGKHAMPCYRSTPVERAELTEPGVLGAAALVLDAAV